MGPNGIGTLASLRPPMMIQSQHCAHQLMFQSNTYTDSLSAREPSPSPPRQPHNLHPLDTSSNLPPPLRLHSFNFRRRTNDEFLTPSKHIRPTHHQLLSPSACLLLLLRLLSTTPDLHMRLVTRETQLDVTGSEKAAMWTTGSNKVITRGQLRYDCECA